MKITKKEIITTGIEITSILVGATAARIACLLITKVINKATK